MSNEYRRTATTVSLINYHFVFCPRYRRKIFDIPGVEERFKTLVSCVCERNSIQILAMECHHDHAHLFLSCTPSQSPAEVMKIIKGGTSHEIRQEFPRLSQMPNLWTRSYFVSTAGNVSSETIEWYVSTQKSR
jgi:putative transposase